MNKYTEYLDALTATKDAVKDSEANAIKYKDEAKSFSDSAKTSEVNAKASEVAAAESAEQAAAGQINADWNETNVASKAFIKNKPDVVLKSNLASSVSTSSLTVTGETSVPTANEGNSSNTIASTEFVAKSLAKMVDSAPESLNTLNELAKALGNDPNFATTVINELAKKLNSTEANDTFVAKTSIAIEDWRDKAEAPSTNDQIPVFKACSKAVTKTPQNGLMLSYGGGSNSWRGQLFLSDNPNDGVWYGGYAGTSTHSGWKRMANYNTDGHLVFPNGAEMWVY